MDLDTVESTGSYPVMHSTVTLDPSGKIVFEWNSDVKMTCSLRTGLPQGPVEINSNNWHYSHQMQNSINRSNTILVIITHFCLCFLSIFGVMKYLNVIARPKAH